MPVLGTRIHPDVFDRVKALADETGVSGYRKAHWVAEAILEKLERGAA